MLHDYTEVYQYHRDQNRWFSRHGYFGDSGNSGTEWRLVYPLFLMPHRDLMYVLGKRRKKRPDIPAFTKFVMIWLQVPTRWMVKVARYSGSKTLNPYLNHPPSAIAWRSLIIRLATGHSWSDFLMYTVQRLWRWWKSVVTLLWRRQSFTKRTGATLGTFVPRSQSVASMSLIPKVWTNFFCPRIMRSSASFLYS